MMLMVYGLFALVIVAVVATLIAVAAVVFGAIGAAFGAAFGAGAALGAVATRGGEAPPGTWWGWLGVSLLGSVGAWIINAAAVALFVIVRVEAAPAHDSLREPGAGAPTDAALRWVSYEPLTFGLLCLAPAVGGALAGLWHVLLRKRPKRWILGWTIALGLPCYGLAFTAINLARSFWEHLLVSIRGG